MRSKLYSATMRRVGTWRGIKTKFFMFKRLLLVVFLAMLDIRDLYYKVVLMGPVDSFSFTSGGTSFLDSMPVLSNVTSGARDRNLVSSGWSSFLSTCDEIYPFVGEGSTFFLMAKLTNCRIHVNGSATTAPPLVVISAVRVDSMAWAACHLIHMGRRPSVCGDTMVINFNKRYAFSDAIINHDMVAPVGSDAEAELLRFLDLVGVSFPLEKMICVEAFPLPDNAYRGTFLPSVFACASPNLYRAEFVGFAATTFERLQGSKGWLTEDALTIASSRYGIRQNCNSTYYIDDAQVKDTNGVLRKTISIRNDTSTNFSSHGLLFAVVVILDTILFFTHGRSIAELVKWMGKKQYYELQRWMQDFDDLHHEQFPRLDMVPHGVRKSIDPRASRPDLSPPPFDETQFYAFFPKSFYRSYRYRAMLLTTRILSWVIIVPNSVTWTWSDSLWMKFQAYLCSIKSWVLVVAVFNWVWKGLVWFNEPFAYGISRRTHLLNQEIIAISSLVSLWQSPYIFSICEEKWDAENQRVNDFDSFSGYIAHGNTYERTEESKIFSPFHTVWIIYSPLVRIILWSVFMIGVWLAVKATTHELWGCITGKHIIDQVYNGQYARLPLEVSLNSPIRALSIIRYQLSMEVVKDGQVYLRPSCYLDYGVMLKTAEPKNLPPVNGIFKRHPAKVYMTTANE